VEDYILKPLTKSKLIDTLNKTIALIEKEKSRRNLELESIEKYYKSIGLLESNFLNNIVLGRKMHKYIDQYRDLFDIPLIRGHFITIKFSNLKATTDWNDVEDYNNRVADCLEYLKTYIKYNYKCLISNVAVDKIYIYLEFEEDVIYDDVLAFFEKNHGKVLKKFNLKHRVSIGSLKSIEEVFTSYEESMYMLKVSKSNVETFEHRHVIATDLDKFNKLLDELYDEFCGKSSKFTSTLKKIVSLFEPISGRYPEISEFALFEKLVLIYKVCRDANIISRELYMSKNYLKEYKKLSPLGRIVYFDENLRTMFKLYKELEGSNYSEITLKAISYIDAHIKTDVSLNMISSEIGVSSQYLSRVFKAETGKTFKEYHVGLRIDKAKKLLLEGGLSVREVSDELGYNDYNYFIRMFKKITGRTPSSLKGDFDE
jgi:two-component system response regulator YesN